MLCWEQFFTHIWVQWEMLMWSINDIGYESGKKNDGKCIVYVWFQELSGLLILIISQKCKIINLVPIFLSQNPFRKDNQELNTFSFLYSKKMLIDDSLSSCYRFNIHLLSKKWQDVQQYILLFWKTSLIETELFLNASEEWEKHPKGPCSWDMSFLL